MRKLQWLEVWIPDGLHSAIRYAPPTEHEQIVTTKAALEYTKTLIELADRQEEIPEQTTRATAITMTAAVLADYLYTISERTGRAADPDLEEWEDTPPEILQAEKNLRHSTRIAIELAERAREKLAQAGLENEPKETQLDTSEKARRTFAETASMAGNNAALEWHFNQLAQRYPENQENIVGGHILSMWANSENFTLYQPRKTEDADPEYQTALKNCSKITAMLENTDHLEYIENHRPIIASPGALEQWEEGDVEFFASQISWDYRTNQAIYGYEDNEEYKAIMAYCFQGCTHVKLVTEPYQHPIDRDVAIGHCNNLETTMFELEQEGDVLNNSMVKQAIVNRCLIMAALYQTPSEMIHETIDLARDAFQEQTRLEALTNIISDGYHEISQKLATRHEMFKNPLTTEQTKAAFNAARATGAAESAIRDIGTRLGMSHAEIQAQGVENARAIPWETARPILENAYNLKPQPNDSWLSTALIMGWKHDDPMVQRLAAQMEAINQYGANPEDQPI